MLRSIKPPKCKHCRRRLDQMRPGQQVHEECVEGYVLRLRAKKAEAAKKQERAVDRAKRDELDPLPKLLAAAQKAFNSWVRARDARQPCISCGAQPPEEGRLHAGRDAGHYRSVGSASHLRYHEDNVHGQCVHCNQWGAGKAVDYRIGLVQRIGLARVEALEADNRVHKWTRQEVCAIRDTYRAKLRELKARKA
jgi:hypothetical protein